MPNNRDAVPAALLALVEVLVSAHGRPVTVRIEAPGLAVDVLVREKSEGVRINADLKRHAEHELHSSPSCSAT